MVLLGKCDCSPAVYTGQWAVLKLPAFDGSASWVSKPIELAYGSIYHLRTRLAWPATSRVHSFVGAACGVTSADLDITAGVFTFLNEVLPALSFAIDDQTLLFLPGDFLGGIHDKSGLEAWTTYCRRASDVDRSLYEPARHIAWYDTTLHSENFFMFQRDELVPLSFHGEDYLAAPYYTVSARYRSASNATHRIQVTAATQVTDGRFPDLINADVEFETRCRVLIELERAAP
jgi:hypothetical protein